MESKAPLIALALLAVIGSLGYEEDTVVPESVFPEDTPDHDPSISPKADGISIEQLIHPRLKQLAKSTMPHQWDTILSDKDLPIDSLLQLPMGKMSCTEGRRAIGCDASNLEECEIEVEAIHKGSLGRTRRLKAHVLEVHGEDKMTLLVRGFREPKEHEKDKREEIPFHDTVVDPMRDVVMEATQVNSDGQCHDFTIHHPTSGTAELSAIFEKDGRKGLTQMLQPLHKKMTQKLQESGLVKTTKRADGTEELSLVSHEEAKKLPAIVAAHDRFKAAFDKAQTWEAAAKADQAYQKSVREALSEVDEDDDDESQTEKDADHLLQRPDWMPNWVPNFDDSPASLEYDRLKRNAYNAAVTKAKQTMSVKSTDECRSFRRRGVTDSNMRERLDAGHKSCIACIELISGKNLIDKHVTLTHSEPTRSAKYSGSDAPNNGKKCFKNKRQGKTGKKWVDPKCVHCTCISECTEFIEQCYESNQVKYLGCYQEHGWPYHEKTVPSHQRLTRAQVRGGKGSDRKFGHMMEKYMGLKQGKEDCMHSCGDEHQLGGGGTYQYAGYGVWGMCFCGNSYAEPGKVYPELSDHNCPEQKGGNHHGKGSLAVFQQEDSSQLTNARLACAQEDDKELDCVEQSVMKFFKGKLCAGLTVCSLTDDAVMSVVVGVVVWIVDELIGCALGFWCQPSFWQGMKTPDGQASAAANQGASAAKEGVSTAYEEAMTDTLEERGIQKSYAKKDSKELGKQAVTVAQKRGVAASTIRVTKNFFKNLIPCLPLAIMAWLEGGTSFFMCMGQCLLQALGATIVEMVFNLVKDCLWKYIEEALKSTCFPSDAQVHVEGGGTKQMQHIRVGDRVLTSNGLYSDVYVLSHQDPHVSLGYINIRLDSNNTIEASPGHFIPASPDCKASTQHLRASVIQEGMCLLVPQEGLVRVAEVSRVIKRGMFNPFTLAGDIVVNGVVASSHSEWFLDELADKFGFSHLLPSIYQVVLAPARGLYHLVGPAAARQELEEYQAQMALVTENNWVVKPYLDLTWRAWTVITGSK